MATTSEAEQQKATTIGARRGQIVAIAVDGTARSYDLRLLPFGGQAFQQSFKEAVFITLANDGGVPLYYQLNQDGTADIDPSANIAISNPPAFTNTHCQAIFSNTKEVIRLDRFVDKFIVIRTAGSATTLRLSVSSPPTVQLF